MCLRSVSAILDVRFKKQKKGDMKYASTFKPAQNRWDLIKFWSIYLYFSLKFEFGLRLVPIVYK